MDAKEALAVIKKIMESDVLQISGNGIYLEGKLGAKCRESANVYTILYLALAGHEEYLENLTPEEML